MGNRKIAKVTPAMEWQRKRWAAKGQLAACKKMIEGLETCGVLTSREAKRLSEVRTKIDSLLPNWWKDKGADRDAWLADWRYKNAKIKSSLGSKGKGGSNGA